MNRRLYACIVLLIIAVCSSGSIKNDHSRQTSSIEYSPGIKDYDDIYHILKDSIIGGQAPYRLGVYDHLSNNDDHILYFEVKEMPPQTGGETRCSNLTARPFIDTITLNSEFLKRGCKEYIVQVIAHESIHALINWCVHSYHMNKNKFGVEFLQSVFRTDRDSIEAIIKDTSRLTEDKKHGLMCRNYLDSMSRCIYQYTRRDSQGNLQLRLLDSIARPLAWGGLTDTQEWQNRVDTCLSSWVDVAAIKFNGPSKEKWIQYPSCYKTRLHNKLREQMKGVFQKTKSATYNNKIY